MRKKKLLSLLLVGTMVAGLITGCGSSSKDTSKSDSGKSKGGKVVLNVINYHVGTDYAADYYKYLFDAFKKTDEGKAETIPMTKQGGRSERRLLCRAGQGQLRGPRLQGQRRPL